MELLIFSFKQILIEVEKLDIVFGTAASPTKVFLVRAQGLAIVAFYSPSNLMSVVQTPAVPAKRLICFSGNLL